MVDHPAGRAHAVRSDVEEDHTPDHDPDPVTKPIDRVGGLKPGICPFNSGKNPHHDSNNFILDCQMRSLDV